MSSTLIIPRCGMPRYRPNTQPPKSWHPRSIPPIISAVPGIEPPSPIIISMEEIEKLENDTFYR